MKDANDNPNQDSCRDGRSQIIRPRLGFVTELFAAFLVRLVQSIDFLIFRTAFPKKFLHLGFAFEGKGKHCLHECQDNPECRRGSFTTNENISQSKHLVSRRYRRAEFLVQIFEIEHQEYQPDVTKHF
jgi:hypothetical protein